MAKRYRSRKELVRLQKVLSQAGIASRRASEQMIREGRVQVNGHVVVEMGAQVDPARDEILVDGERVEVSSPRRYIALHKPPGVLSVMHDARGRRDLSSLVPGIEGVHPVGRLDRDSEGLILLTDDGPLTYRLTHPRYEHDKEYAVLVSGGLTGAALRRLRHGIDLEEGRTAPARVSQVQDTRWGDTPPGTIWLHVVLHEGRKRQIRRMCAAVGLSVRRLIRVRIGPIVLGTLAPGANRPLRDTELAQLRKAVGQRSPRAPGGTSTGASGSASRRYRGRRSEGPSRRKVTVRRKPRRKPE